MVEGVGVTRATLYQRKTSLHHPSLPDASLVRCSRVVSILMQKIQHCSGDISLSMRMRLETLAWILLA